MPRNFIANDPSNIESSQSWLHIRGVVRPNDTERTMWWNWILILPIKAIETAQNFCLCGEEERVAYERHREDEKQQRRDVKKVRWNHVYRIMFFPFHGRSTSVALRLSTPRFYFTQSPTEKKAKALRLSQRPKGLPHSRKPWESNFFMFVALCFLMDSKARNRKKANFKSSRNCNRIKAGWLQPSFSHGPPNSISDWHFSVEVAIDSIPFLRFNRQVESIRLCDPISRLESAFGGEKARIFPQFPSWSLCNRFRYETPWNREAQSEAFERNPGRWINYHRRVRPHINKFSIVRPF